MSTDKILNYLCELSKNNNREWYHSHKAEYKEASSCFETLLSELILRIGETDSSILHCVPGELTFKLVRDTRFSHDKSPYNPAFRAHISSRGKLPVPVGYYIMIKPFDNSFLGGGLFADMFKDATKAVRDYIAANPAEWQEIINEPSFKKYFRVRGEVLKNVPKEYDRQHPQAEFLKHKSWYLEYTIKDDFLKNTVDFMDTATDVFKCMRPFNDFLNTALANFKMPER